jgi:hypothetical protein
MPSRVKAATYGEPMIVDPISESEWRYEGLPDQRIALLSGPCTFEQLTVRILTDGAIVEWGRDRYHSWKTEAEKRARQVIFRAALSPPELCDLFFNGRDGLRARYWHSPEAGDAATRYLIDSLLPVLEKTAATTPPSYTGFAEPMTEADIHISLTSRSAKAWPVESERDSKGGLEVKRWSEARPDGQWRWTPQRCDLEVKGAIIDLQQVEIVPSSKRDRAGQIHRVGFS